MGRTPSREVQELALLDAVKAAELSVRHWDGELSTRIQAAQALDGVGGWMSKLLGSYDDDVDAAIAQVQQARVALAQARAQLVEAKQEVAAMQEAKVEEADAQVSRVLQIEERVAALHREGGAVAEQLLELEARMAPLQARADRLSVATESGRDVIMELSRARQAAASARSRVKTASDVGLVDVLSAGRMNMLDLLIEGTDPSMPMTEARSVEVHTISDAALGWEEAMVALGSELPLTFPDVVERLLGLDGLWEDPNGYDHQLVMVLSEVEGLVRDIGGRLTRLREQLDDMHAQRATLVGA